MLPLLFLIAQLRPEPLATDLRGGYQVLAVDLNRDGRTDLIALASGLNHLDWFENPGQRGQPWQRHTIARGFRQLINVAALDVDKDGMVELLIAHDFSNVPANSIGTVSLFRASADPTQEWTGRVIEKRPTSHRLKVANGQFVNAPLAHPQAKPPEYRGSVPIVVYDGPELKPRVISEEEAGVMHGLGVFDLNADGRHDIFAASFLGISAYLANSNGGYTRTFLHAGSPLPWPHSGSSEIALIRLRKQSKQDFALASIDPWHGNELAIYEQTKSGWKRSVLDMKLSEGHTLLPIDLNRDGVEELIYGSRKEGGTLRIAEYSRKNRQWTTRSLWDGKIATSSCVALDADQDKKPDFACIGGASANLLLFWNEGQ